MKCYECGKEMIPASFGRRIDGSPLIEGFAGYDAGEENSQGEIWLRCPDGHRGAWVPADWEFARVSFHGN